MFEYQGILNRAAIRASIRSVYSTKDKESHILFEGVDIGTLVSLGPIQNGNGNPSGRTRYASRVDWDGIAINVEGISTTAVLKKVAAQIGDLIERKQSSRISTGTPSRYHVTA